MDDMFEDLLSPPKKQPDPPPATQQQGGPEGSVPGGTSENGSVKHQQGGGDGKDAEHQPQAPGLVGVSKEELHSLVSVAVEGAMDNLLGKFVKSLRTVSWSGEQACVKRRKLCAQVPHLPGSWSRQESMLTLHLCTAKLGCCVCTVRQITVTSETVLHRACLPMPVRTQIIIKRMHYTGTEEYRQGRGTAGRSHASNTAC
eukprot:scaffold48578_cov16-Tisochrysis_lutea.AAC.2